MKKVLFLILTSLLFLGACGNSGETKDNSNSKLSAEEQEETYKKASKKLGKAIVDEENSGDNDSVSKENLKELEKAAKNYENKTKNLDSIETEIGDYALRVANTIVAFGDRYIELEDFKKDNSDKESAYDLAIADLAVNMAVTLDSINMDYEDFDIEYKNEYLGKEANEEITDLLATFPGEEIQNLADGYGAMIVEFDDDLTESQNKILSNTEYRSEFNKAMVTEEAEVSKNEFNNTVDDFNDLSPEFLHYDKVNKMVSATENLAMGDIRNGVVGADTDAAVDDYDFEEDEGELEDEEDDIEEKMDISDE